MRLRAWFRRLRAWLQRESVAPQVVMGASVIDFGVSDPTAVVVEPSAPNVVFPMEQVSTHLYLVLHKGNY